MPLGCTEPHATGIMKPIRRARGAFKEAPGQGPELLPVADGLMFHMPAGGQRVESYGGSVNIFDICGAAGCRTDQPGAKAKDVDRMDPQICCASLCLPALPHDVVLSSEISPKMKGRS